MISILELRRPIDQKITGTGTGKVALIIRLLGRKETDYGLGGGGYFSGLTRMPGAYGLAPAIWGIHHFLLSDRCIRKVLIENFFGFRFGRFAIATAQSY
jgi:hypothetical protein